MNKDDPEHEIIALRVVLISAFGLSVNLSYPNDSICLMRDIALR